MRKQLASYRIPKGLLAAVTLEAAERGETVTDMVIRSMAAYIQRGEAAGIVLAAPVSVATVHTAPEDPPWAIEADEELPEDPPCRHPAEAVHDGVCQECGEDVW